MERKTESQQEKQGKEESQKVRGTAVGQKKRNAHKWIEKEIQGRDEKVRCTRSKAQ